MHLLHLGSAGCMPWATAAAELQVLLCVCTSLLGAVVSLQHVIN